MFKIKSVFFLGVFATVLFSPSSVFGVLNQEEQTCYEVVRSAANQIPLGDEFLDLAPENLGSANFLDQKSGESIIPHVKFNKSFFGVKIYSFGDELPLKRSDIAPVNKFLNDQNSDFVDDTLHQFEFLTFYDLGDREILGCKLNIKESAEELEVSDLTKDKFIAQTKPIVIKNYKTVKKNGEEFKLVSFEKDKMDKSYENPIYTQYTVMAIPESERTDFNPWSLVDVFVNQTNDFYDVFLPAAEKEISYLSKISERDLKKQISHKTDDLTIYSYKANYGGIRGVDDVQIYGIPLMSFGEKINCLYNYLPWYRDEITKQMIQEGQEDVMNIWLSHRGDERSGLVEVGLGNKTTDQVLEDYSEEEVLSNSLIKQLDNLIHRFGFVAAWKGDEEPEKSEDVQLFWRLKERLEDGGSEKDIKNLISEYPAYLKLVDDFQKKSLGEGRFANLKDVDFESWYADFIEELMKLGVLDGYEDETFRPDNLVNRAEMAKIATALFDLNIPEIILSDPFPDVPKDSWFAPFVTAAKDAGVVNGYSDGNFRPAQTVNRAEAIKMLLGASGQKIMSSNRKKFKDVSSSDWFGPFVNFAQSAGIVSGYSDGAFRPGNLVNRAEIAKMAAIARRVFEREDE